MKSLCHFFIASLIVVFILTSQQSYAGNHKQSGSNGNHVHSSKEKHDKNKAKTKTKKKDKKEKHSKNKDKDKNKNQDKKKNKKEKSSKSKDKAKNQDKKEHKHKEQDKKQKQTPDDSPDYSLIQIESPEIDSMYVGDFKVFNYVIKNNSDFLIVFQDISDLSEPLEHYIQTKQLFLFPGETFEFSFWAYPKETGYISQEFKIQYAKVTYNPTIYNYEYKIKDIRIANMPIKINVADRFEQPKSEQPNKNKEKTPNATPKQPNKKKSVENEGTPEASEELYNQNVDQTPLEEDIDHTNYTSTKIAVELLKPNIYVNETVQLECIVKNKSGYEIAFQNVSDYSDSIECITDSKTIALKPNGFAKIIFNVSPKELKNISQILKIKYARANYNETSGKYDPDKRYIKTYEESIKLTVEDGSELLKIVERTLKEENNKTNNSARRVLNINMYENNCGVISTAYHKLSRIIHPDRIKNPPLGVKKEDFQTAFNIAASANEVLQNICTR